MVSVNPYSVQTQTYSQNRETTTAFREDSSVKERLQTTRPFGTSVSPSESSTEKNYSKQQNFADAKLPEISSGQGNRRGSLLDLSV